MPVEDEMCVMRERKKPTKVENSRGQVAVLEGLKP